MTGTADNQPVIGVVLQGNEVVERGLQEMSGQPATSSIATLLPSAWAVSIFD